ncbi:MAG: hypothetical protein AAF557_15910 [Pseudomonadota bacterium]
MVAFLRRAVSILFILASLAPLVLSVAAWGATVHQCPDGSDCCDARMSGIFGIVYTLFLLGIACLIWPKARGQY